MSTSVATPDVPGPTGTRLEDQINWYNRRSKRCQRWYKVIKIIEIVAAALIPFLSALHISENNAGHHMLGTVTALLGVAITILEGLLQLNQFQHNWITYRATCEALKHEKYLYLAGAGDYAKSANPLALLAERVEALGSQENTRWASIQQQPIKAKESEDADPQSTRAGT